jgi:hypothetical protein
MVWRRRKLKTDHFMERWRELQKHCSTRKTWPLAIIEADQLLHEALAQAGYKGKTTGERLVAAQRTLTDNEAVWFGHKLRNRIADIDVRKLHKQEIIEALQGFRQALRDIGALDVPREVPVDD